MAQLYFAGIMGGPETLIAAASPQNITGAWADLGAELTLRGARTIGFFVSLDINGSTNVRLRFLAKHESGGADEYVLPIRTVGVSDVKLEDEYFEFNDDADQKMLLKVDLDGLVAFGQLQVMAGVLGAPAAQIDELVVTTAH